MSAGHNVSYLDQICFVMLFSCGASGMSHVQTTKQWLLVVVWPAPKVNEISERSVARIDTEYTKKKRTFVAASAFTSGVQI
jgi:hypothetical protein